MILSSLIWSINILREVDVDYGSLHYLLELVAVFGPAVHLYIRDVGILLQKGAGVQDKVGEVFPDAKPPCRGEREGL